MSKLRAVPPRSQQRQRTYIPNTLASSTHAFVRCDAVRKSLQQPYNGPFKIINRSDKHYTLLVNGKKKDMEGRSLLSDHPFSVVR